jgi:hypothetical protein
MTKDEQDKPAKVRRPGNATALLAGACLAAVCAATAYLSWRLDTLDEHINSARIAAEEAERAAGEAAQNSANPRQRDAADGRAAGEASAAPQAGASQSGASDGAGPRTPAP